MGFPSFSSLKDRRVVTRGGSTLDADAQSEGNQTAQTTAQNLLAHIPGEASGFYLLAVDNLQDPTTGTLVFIFLLALILLILVRVLGKASRAVILTSLGAFVVWMLVLDQGLFHVLAPNLLPDPLGLIVAIFYSSAITALANAGVIK
ncbi:MAG: hypothetical protein IT320_27155 [Anaerolineae bacterium]|nr:hypothetical protein [Anaerolineae bacterium]